MIDESLARIPKQIKKCEFGHLVGRFLRDEIIIKVSNEELRKRTYLIADDRTLSDHAKYRIERRELRSQSTKKSDSSSDLLDCRHLMNYTHTQRLSSIWKAAWANRGFKKKIRSKSCMQTWKRESTEWWSMISNKMNLVGIQNCEDCWAETINVDGYGVLIKLDTSKTIVLPEWDM